MARTKIRCVRREGQGEDGWCVTRAVGSGSDGGHLRRAGDVDVVVVVAAGEVEGCPVGRQREGDRLARREVVGQGEGLTRGRLGRDAGVNGGCRRGRDRVVRQAGGGAGRAHGKKKAAGQRQQGGESSGGDTTQTELEGLGFQWGKPPWLSLRGPSQADNGGPRLDLPGTTPSKTLGPERPTFVDGALALFQIPVRPGANDRPGERSDAEDTTE